MNQQAATPSIVEELPQAENLTLNMVAFEIDGQVFTLPIDQIYRIIEMVYLTHLPEVNESIEGIFNYHGTTVPVVNLRRFLHLPRQPIQLHTPIILVEFHGHVIGLIVDRVIGVVNEVQSSIQHPKDLMPAPLGEIAILDGLIQNSENYMLMLNLEQLFAGPRNINLLQSIDQIVSPQENPETGLNQARPLPTSSSGSEEPTPVAQAPQTIDGNGAHEKPSRPKKQTGNGSKQPVRRVTRPSVHEEGKN